MVEMAEESTVAAVRAVAVGVAVMVVVMVVAL